MCYVSEETPLFFKKRLLCLFCTSFTLVMNRLIRELFTHVIYKEQTIPLRRGTQSSGLKIKEEEWTINEQPPRVSLLNKKD